VIVRRFTMLIFMACMFMSEPVKVPGQSSRAKVKVSTPGPAEPAKTLGAFRRQFLNQQILINDVAYEEKYCLEWTIAEPKSDGTFVEAKGIYNHLPFSYRGGTATVVAIQLAPTFLQKTRVGDTNAFGEPAAEDEIADPYMDVIAKLENGTVAMVRGYPITLVPQVMELASVRNSARRTIESQLQAIIGKDLYAVGYSHLYKSTATVEEMSGSQELLARLSFSDIPLLQPIKIVKVRLLPESGDVVFKVLLPSGSEAIAYTPASYIDLTQEKQSFLSQISGTLLATIPTGLTPREIKAVKERAVFRGMSADAVDYALGFKDSENNWGRGGRQLSYYHGKMLVYINSSNKVEEVQTFE
jgi:hypothetical protein